MVVTQNTDLEFEFCDLELFTVWQWAEVALGESGKAEAVFP